MHHPQQQPQGRTQRIRHPYPKYSEHPTAASHSLISFPERYNGRKWVGVASLELCPLPAFCTSGAWGREQRLQGIPPGRGCRDPLTISIPSHAEGKDGELRPGLQTSTQRPGASNNSAAGAFVKRRKLETPADIMGLVLPGSKRLWSPAQKHPHIRRCCPHRATCCLPSLLRTQQGHIFELHLHQPTGITHNMRNTSSIQCLG